MTAGLAALLVYATQLLAGALLARPWTATRLDLAARAVLLGPLALTLQVFAYGLVGAPASLLTVGAPWWLAGLVFARRLLPERAPAAAGSGWERAFLALVLALSATLFLFGLAVPVYHGDAVWNFALPARAIAEASGLSVDALLALPADASPAYPPLVAVNEALVFGVAGNAGSLAVKPFFALAWLGWGLLLAGALRRAGPSAGTFAVAVIALLVPELAELGLVGLADLRFVAALLGLLLALSDLRDRRAELATAVLFALACAWTKREGVVLALLLAPVLFVLAKRASGLPRAAGAATLLLAGALAWPVFVAAHGLHEANVELNPTDWEFARYGEALAGFVTAPIEAIHVEDPSWYLLPLAGLVGVLLLVATRRLRGLPLALLVGAVLHFLAYPALLLGAAHDLDWQVRTAAPRLALHLLPWFALLAFEGARATYSLGSPSGSRSSETELMQ